MNKFTVKAVLWTMILTMSTSSVMAAVNYPTINDLPNTSVRVMLEDTDDDLYDLSIDLLPRDGAENFYEAGDLVVFGNNQNDEDNEDSFNQFVLDFENEANIDAYGIITKNSSNTNNIVYDIVVANATANAITGANTNTMYAYTDTKVPGSSVSSINNMLEDAVEANNTVDVANNGGTGDSNNGEYTMDDYMDDAVFSDSIGSGNTHKGDPDVVTDYMDEVWVYVKTTATTGALEYAWHFDMVLGSSDQAFATSEVSAVKLLARGTHGRIDITPGDMSGVVGWQIDFSGDYVDTIETTFPVVFFDPHIDNEFDVEVYTINAEGDTSNNPIEIVNKKANRVNIKHHLSDIEDTTFYHYIEYLYKLGIIDGYSNGTYRPDEIVTRGQLAKFVMNAFDLPFNTGGEWFPDVSPTDTFGPYIQSLMNAGVIAGYSDGTYRADEVVSRGAATKFIFNAATYYNEDAIDTSSCSYNDSAYFGVFEPYICGLSEHVVDNYQPIIAGYSNGDFGANDSLTRGAMAKIILNAGMMIDGALGGVPFISGGLGDRDFIAPIVVDNFEVTNQTHELVNLAWDDMSVADDTDVDGYLIERREEGEGDDKWDNLDGTDGSDNGVVVAPDGTFDDDDVDDETRYEYRLAAFKWIPVNYADTYYQNQATMESETEDRFNMLIGPWSYDTVKTDEKP